MPTIRNTEMITCPRCENKIGDTDDKCSSCGFCLAVISKKINKSKIEIGRVVDIINLLKPGEMVFLEKKIAEFEAKLPQLAISIIIIELEKDYSIGEFGFWLLNHAVFVREEIIKSGSSGIVIIVNIYSEDNINNNSISAFTGYFLENIISSQEIEKIIQKSKLSVTSGRNTKFSQFGDFGKVLEKIVTAIQKKLIKRAKAETQKKLSA